MRMMLISLLTIMLSIPVYAATYVKSDAGDKLVVVTEVTTELTPAQIQHEIDGCQNDQDRLQAQIDEIGIRKAKHEEMLTTCATMDIKPVVIKIDEIEKPIEEPIIEEEHTI